MMRTVERVALTLWVGGMWAIGYLAVPTLFGALGDRRLAGAVAARLVGAMALAGVACGLILLVVRLYRLRRLDWRDAVLLVMLGITILGQWVLLPVMDGLHPARGPNLPFDVLHTVAGVLFAVNSLLGLLLVVTDAEPLPGAGRAG